MKNTSLSEMSSDEIIKNKKTIGAATAALAGLLLFLLILSIYKWMTKDFTLQVVVPLALSPIVFLNIKKIKEMKRELQSREQL